MLRRVLLIAPHGSYRTVPFLNAAKRQNLDVLIASEGQYSLVSEYAQGLHINLDDIPTALARIALVAQQQPFCGVVGTDDASVELTDQVAAHLALPHNSPGAARIARRKDLARACLQAAGVHVPWFHIVDLTQSLGAQLEAVTFPCVAKPVALSASRGVIRANNHKELIEACIRIQRILSRIKNVEEQERILIEGFIPGVEIAIEGLLRQGELEILAIFDKPDPLDGPYFEETYYITPSRLSPSVQAQAKQEVAAACRAYGLREGPIHAECRVNAAGVWILEVAARTIGGLCGQLLRFGTGYTLEELVLMHATQQLTRPMVIEGAAGVLMIPIPQAGILKRVEGLGAAERVPGVQEINIQVREGYELIPLPEGASYLGFIFAQGESPQEVEAALRAAHAQLRIVVSPLWKTRLA